MYNSYAFWIIIFALALFLLWFFGEGEYEFIGIRPLLEKKRDVSNISNTNMSNTNIPKVDVEKEKNNKQDIPNQNTENKQDIPKPNTNSEDKNKLSGKVLATRRRFRSNGEEICCTTLEELFGKPFKTTRPAWLTNPETSRRMELDCYNKDLQLAVEYQGAQHYNFPNFTGQTREQFISQIRRDSLKPILCDKNGVFLITVPHHIPHTDIKNYIIDNLPDDLFRLIK